MDSLERYRSIVRSILSDYARFKPSLGEVEVELVLDDEQGHYELLHTGWSGDHRVHGSVIHVDIRGGKIWIQHDGTERGVALELVEKGVAREDIVLAFKHPDARSLTDYAVK